jgi:replicative DNA helicase
MKDIRLKPLKIKFNVTTLDMVIAFIYKDSVLRTRKTLSNIFKLFTNLDMQYYSNNPELYNRVWIITKTLEGKLYQGFESDDFLTQYCLDASDCDEYKSDIIKLMCNKKITHEESKHLIKKLDDTLEYGYTATVKDIMMELLNKIEDGDFRSYQSVSDDLYDIANSIISIKRSTSSLNSDQTFSLQDEMFEQVIEDAVQKLKDRNRIFITGIQRWNTILSPGYLSKRLYTYLAFPGKGKSTILLKSALDIRKYNAGIKTKDPDKRPAVLFLTLENDIPETVERLYNMAVDSDDLRNYTPKQVIKKIRNNGFKLTNEDNIDIIIKEYKNRELDTNDLYTIIQDLNDDGIEIITLIVDYLKRVRPAEKAASEKEELKNITNELKELAKFFDIPVVTAQQLNRNASSVVDAALQAKKEDVTRLVGRDGIAGAWEIIENSDVVIIINPEVKSDTNDLYLTFKLLKRRYRSSEEDEKLRRLEYFNHPFEPDNGIRLIDDIEFDKPLSLESLSTKFEAVDNKRGKTNAVERDSKDDANTNENINNKKKKSSFDEEFEPFDFDKAANF